MIIAIVEDHAELRCELVYYLTRHGHSVFGLSNSLELDSLIKNTVPGLLFIDIGLPGESGIEIARRYNSTSGLSIVMLTACCDVESRVRSFEAGADTFLSKPVSFRELDAVIHRAESRRNATSSISCWQLFPIEKLLVSPNGHKISLTLTESRLMKELFSQPEKIASRKSLVTALGANFMVYDDRRIEVSISRLRKKIEVISGLKAPIKSVRNIGYVLESSCILR